MPAKLKKLYGEPIVVETMSADYHLVDEAPKGVPEVLKFLDHLTEPVFWVVDISAVEEVSIEDLLKGTELVAQGQNAVYRHRNIREVLYVSTSRMIKMAAAGLGNAKFGNLKVQVFENLETALQYAREQH